MSGRSAAYGIPARRASRTRSIRLSHADRGLLLSSWLMLETCPARFVRSCLNLDQQKELFRGRRLDAPGVRSAADSMNNELHWVDYRVLQNRGGQVVCSPIWVNQNYRRQSRRTP